MSKFIFVSGSYDPYPKANAVCAMSVEKALKDKGHEIIYVVTRNNSTQNNVEIINGNKVYFIPKTINEIHWFLDKANESFYVSNLEKFVVNCADLFLKISFKVLALMNWKSSSSRAIEIYKNNFEKVMSKLLEQEQPDAILTFSVPFSSHLYTFESLKKSKIKPIWNSFLIDTHSQKTNIDLKTKQIFADEENSVFKNSDKVFLLNTLQEGYSFEKYSEWFHKFIFFKLPFFKLPLEYNFKSNDGIHKSSNTIDISFAGTLYDDSSPIDFLCNYIDACKDKNIRFHFMGKFYPKNNEKLNNLANLMPSQVFLYGFKSREFVLSSLQKSDVLINIGNNNTNQIPSKILEYIGLQKPIFSFIRDENDAALEYLNKYPYSFVINENKEVSMADLVNQSLDFFDNCKKNSVSISKLRKDFEGYLEEDVTSQIVEIIEKQLYDKRKN